jgi:diguanylate cyclase (GGDEF)-like protein
VAEYSHPIELVSVPAAPDEPVEAETSMPHATHSAGGRVVRLGTQLSADIAVSESGIALIYRALDRLVDELGLDDAALVVDDADLGRQVFRAGRRGLREGEMRLIDLPPGLYTSPPTPDTSFDASILTSLSLVALRLDLQRDDSAHDSLTGLYTRRTFTRLLETAIARSRRLGWRFALVLIDLDDLKAVNDTYGHPAGDAALRTLAEYLRASLRSSDDAARIGGDEFALLLPETGAEQVVQFFERIDTTHDEAMPRFSFGAAICPADATDSDALFKLADERLYEAKRRRAR